MSCKVRVVPAILTDNFDILQTMIHSSEEFAEYVQIDIMDGRFVPSSSILAADIAAVKPVLDWEAHIMVLNPEEYIEGFRDAGAEKIIFHYEATQSPLAVIAAIKNLGIQAGIAVNPETPVPDILPLVGELDSVLFMSVHPGFYGAKFLPEVLDKVTELRNACPDLWIGLDGGVKEANIADIAGVGVNDICVGSAVFLQPDPGESYRHLLSLAEASSPYEVV